MERPKFIFFFDEAHLLFDEAPEVLLDKIEQIVRLIRSKGVGVYFITQSAGKKKRHSLRDEDARQTEWGDIPFSDNEPHVQTEDAV